MSASRSMVARVALGVVLAAAVYAAVSPASTSRADAPMPPPFPVEWDVTAPEVAHFGEEVVVSVGVTLSLWGGTAASEPSFHLVLDDGLALELTSPGAVEVESFDAVAGWELRPVREGEVEIEIGLTYRQTWWYPIQSHFVTSTTARTIVVAAIAGDANCDGAVTPVDAALVLQLDAGLLDALPCGAGDVNGDGVTNAVDASLMLQHVAGLLAGF